MFSSVGIVSVYLSNSQMDMLKDKSAGQYQAIAHTLARDVAVMWGRGSWQHSTFSEAVAERVLGYARYYSRHNVNLLITDLTLMEHDSSQAESEMTFVNRGDGYFIYISGRLPEPFGHFLLDYSLDVTGNIMDMRNIQNVLLISVAIFSIIAAFALFFILSHIFHPLDVVAKASREIADGQFDERIRIKGSGELAQVAYDFNKMAERIEGQIEHLEEEARNKQQFVDNFAHEIRTPLTSIYGYAEYMQRAALDEGDVIESATYIMNEANHMKNIANSLLELATLRDYIPIKKEISVSKLFDDVAGSVYKTMRESKMRMICDNDADVICGQEDLIRSLLINLCTNAFKACTPNKGIIRLEAAKKPNGTSISVSDNGSGMLEESLRKITEPFYRPDKSRNRNHGGAGLGLTICKKIAEVHNAEMHIKSVLGEGTTVEIIFTTS